MSVNSGASIRLAFPQGPTDVEKRRNQWIAGLIAPSLDGGPSNNPLWAWTKGFCNLLDRMLTRFRCTNKDCDPLSGRARVREMLREDHLESRLQVVRDGVKESLEGVDVP